MGKSSRNKGKRGEIELAKALRGRKIDLAVESHAEAVGFGRRTAEVYILEGQK